MKKCSKCGFEVEKFYEENYIMKFCSKCGNKFNEENEITHSTFKNNIINEDYVFNSNTSRTRMDKDEIISLFYSLSVLASIFMDFVAIRNGNFRYSMFEPDYGYGVIAILFGVVAMILGFLILYKGYIGNEKLGKAIFNAVLGFMCFILGIVLIS